jgi:glycosyltransferase involved in cell wall biosynthesis
MVNSPLVSVIMPVYNYEKYVEEAIESILDQTFRDFEFIIINDGSTDGTATILARYQQMDSRIQVYRQEHQGIAAARNKGYSFAKGKYVAEMDADDVSFPSRLATEVEYLEKHPEIGVVGTLAKWIDRNGAYLNYYYPMFTPTLPGAIRWCFMFENCLVHVSVMIRYEILAQLGFCRELQSTEDYDLLVRASSITKIATLPYVLMYCRLHDMNSTKFYFQQMRQNTVKIMQSQINQLLGSYVCEEKVYLLVHIGDTLSLEKLEQTFNLIIQLYRTYLKRYPLGRKEAREVAQDASRRLYPIVRVASNISLHKSLFFFIQAVRINPQLLSMRIVIKAVRKLLKGSLIFFQRLV